MSAAVAGYCPMGCGATLFLGDDGYVTCASLKCPRPDAAADLLDDRETDHIVQLDRADFTVRHPLRERLDDALMTCQLGKMIASLDGPPRRLGRYRVRLSDGMWSWVALNGESSAS